MKLSLRNQTTATPQTRTNGNVTHDFQLDREAAGREWFAQNLPELLQRTDRLVRRFPESIRDDARQDILTEAFRCTLSAARRDRLDKLRPATLLSFFARAFSTGRTACSHPATNAMSRMAQHRHGFRIMSLGTTVQDRSSRGRITIADALADRRVGLPLDNVRRNLDYAEIPDRQRLGRTARRLLAFLIATAATGKRVDLARELRIRPSSITQARHRLARALAAEGYAPEHWQPVPPQRSGLVKGNKSSNRLDAATPLNAGTSPGRRA